MKIGEMTSDQFKKFRNDYFSSLAGTNVAVHDHPMTMGSDTMLVSLEIQGVPVLVDEAIHATEVIERLKSICEKHKKSLAPAGEQE